MSSTPPPSGHEKRTEGIAEALGVSEPQPLWVEAVEGPGSGARVLLRAGTLTVGSAADCELVLEDPAVSRHHASVALLAEGVDVRDMKSRNGTFYLGARIQEARVPVGGSIVLGRTRLRFVPEQSVRPASERTELHGLVGTSRASQELFAALEKLGAAETTVLLEGETGVGKDVAARALHALSPRAREPFHVFDCAGVAAEDGLLESALFGHVKGAFTGAEKDRLGAAEAAGRGTLLLDAVGDLPLEAQPKLLRLLESRTFRRLGSPQPRRFEARVLATSQRDLEHDVRAGKFRADLYYRLAGTVLRIPPLRERPEDIALLASHFARAATGHALKLDPGLLMLLQCEPWPGNGRELRNAVEQSLALGRPPTKDAGEKAKSFKEAREALMTRFESSYLTALLEAHAGNVSSAARESGLSRSQFYRLLERHGIRA